MAHPINDMLNRIEKREPVDCNKECRYWAFPHMDRACILSEVYSVKQGEPCYEFDKKKVKE